VTPLVEATFLAFIGAVNLGVGYLIRYRRQYGLIAGYDPKRTANPERLARWVGGWSMALGFEALISALAIGGRVADRRIVLPVFAVAVIVSAIFMFAGSRRRSD
jgi:hypothetical protein